MFRRTDPANQWSDKEKTLFARLDEAFKTDDPQTCPTFVLLLDKLPPLTIYKSAVEFAFALNWQGREVEALRKVYSAWLKNAGSKQELRRLTPEWDVLITIDDEMTEDDLLELFDMGTLHCPDCSKMTLRLIESTEPDGSGEYKECRTCDACDNMVYIVRQNKE